MTIQRDAGNSVAPTLPRSHAPTGSGDALGGAALRTLMALLVMGAGLGWMGSSPALGVPVFGQAFQLRQPDGTMLRVRIWGDEFYQVVESPDGYTLIRDPQTGVICYANLSPDGNSLTSTGIRARETAPGGLPVARHLRISRSAAQRQVERGRARFRDGAAAAQMVSGGPQMAAAPLGNVKGLCLIIDFSDQQATIPAANVDNFCNQAGYTGYSNNGSIRDYFYDVSDGKLVYTNVVPASYFPTTGYYRAKNIESYYDNPKLDCGPTARELIIEALDALDAAGFDFSQLDSDGDGYIDAINAYYAGDCHSGWAKGLWPHSWSVSWTPKAGKPSASGYQITNMGTQLRIGTFCHENGHMICDFPDLYDYGYESAGAGYYCLMASGSHGSGGTNPVEPCAYLKLMAGWATLGLITGNQTGLTVTAGTDFSYKFPHPTLSNEYYLVENRYATGRDAALPSSGIAIWHIDENGSNNNEQMAPASHYEATVVQADGRWDLEKNKNSGDSTDLWRSPTYTTCGPATTPNTNWWSGASSGLLIGNISAAGPTMTFDVGAPPAENNPPDAVDDTASVLGNSTGNAINVLTNDTDPEKDTLTLDSVTDPPHGSASIAGDQILYTPDHGYGGTDSFQYTLSDGHGGTDTATVTVTASAPPVAGPDSLSATEDTPLTFQGSALLANDVAPGGAFLDQAWAKFGGGGGGTTLDDLLFIHHSSGQNWLASGLHDALIAETYIDERNDIYYGIDVSPDSGRPDSLGPTPGDSTNMNHWLPWFNDYLTALLTHDCANGVNVIIMFKSCFPISHITADGTEPGDPFSATQTLTNYKAVYRHPSGPGNTYTSNGYTYKPLEDVFAEHPKTLFAVVTAPPLHYAPSDATDDAAAHRARLFNNWLKNDWLTSYNTAHPGLNNVAVFDWFDFLAYPDNDPSHPNRLKAEYGGTAGDSHPNNTANTASTVAFSTQSAPLTLTAFTQPAHGTLADNGNGSFTYTPNPEYNGPDSFTYTVTDAQGATDTATVSIAVAAVNDPPFVSQPIADVEVNEDAPDTLLDLSTNFDDVDIATNGDVLTFTATLLPPNTPLSIVNQISKSSYQNYLDNKLYTHTGDNRGYGAQHDLAQTNILNEFKSFGLDASLDPFSYSSSTYYNVVGLQKGLTRPDDIYIVGAHYDSVGNPGADDNASGVAGVLEAARILSQYDFAASLAFIAFDREEQNLVGSNAYATEAKAKGDNILGMVSLDMIAYNVKGIGNPGAADIYGRDASNSVKQGLASAVTAFGNGITYTLNGSMDASDQGPFEWQGYPAALLIEEWGNPYYHSAKDTVDTPNYIDYAFATDMTRSAAGYLATVAAVSDNPNLLTATVNGPFANSLTLHYNSNEYGTATITVRATDKAGEFVEDTFTVVVHPANDPPTAVNDTATVDQDSKDNLINVLANDGDVDKDSLALTNVTDPPHGTATIDAAYVKYTPDTGYFGSDSFQYTISDGNGGTASATVSVTVKQAPGASAVYVTTDPSHQGNWKGVYGTDGYRVVQDSSKYPSYAAVVEGGSQWTWAASPTDARALQRDLSGRIAACWYGSSMTFDMNLTDAQVHRIALYFLDWDTFDRGETVEFRDAATNALLDTRTVTAFNAGKYLVWDVRGHVKITMTRTAGANTVLSGIFFGVAPPDTTPPTAPTNLVASAAGQTINLTWTAAADPESGISAYKVYRGTASGGESLLKQIGNVTSYADSATQPDTTYYYKVSAVNGASLEGPQSSEASAKTAPGTTASAVYVTTDTTQQGNWKGLYGTEGYRVVQDSTSYPAYATVTEPSGQWTWASSSSESRALERAASGERVAACWFAATSMTFDLNLTDGQVHRVALYFLDWDTFDRAATVEFRDAASNALLDTRSATAFHNGQYLVWDVRGHVKITITRTGGANAVLSGLFFGVAVPNDPTPPSAPANLIATPAQGLVTLTWTAASDPESGIASYKVYRGTVSGGEAFLKQIGNVTAYADSATQPDTTYYYKVSAVNGAGLEGPQSNEASAKTGPGASAVFVKTDAATHGTWKGTYGTDGYRLVQDSTKYPAYATVTEPANQWTWAGSTSDARALQRETGGERVAACWFDSSKLTFDLDLTDGQVHRIALYCLDWDTSTRAETIEFRDAATDALLDTRSVTAFNAGQYLVWDVRGHVRILITRTSGANAVVSGVFFGATTPAPPPAADPPAGGTTADGPTILLVPDRGPAPLDIQAMALGIEPGTPVTWDFGDGSTPHQGLRIENTHTYLSPGLYTVTLRAGGQTARATVVVEDSPRR